MTSQLSWQPPPVTKCGECPRRIYMGDHRSKCGCLAHEKAKIAWLENKDGITESCPMWQQQKASLDANKEKTS